MSQNKKILMLTSFVSGASFSIILPLIAPLVRELQLSELQGAAFVSASALMTAISAIFIAKQQGKWSIYALLSTGFIGMSLSTLLFNGVLTYSLNYTLPAIILFSLLLLARSVMGMSTALPQIALQTFVMTHEKDEKRRAQEMAKLGAIASIGFVVGPFFTAVFLKWGMVAPLWLSLICFVLLTLLILSKFEREPIVQVDKEIEEKLTDTSGFKPQKAMVWFFLGISLYMVMISVSLTAGFYLQDTFKLASSETAKYFTQCSLLVGVVLAITQISITKLFNWSLKTLVSVGLIAMLIGLGISVTAQSILVFQSAYIFYGVAFACLIPAFTTGAAESTTQQYQEKMAGLCTAIQAGSCVVAPLLTSAIYKYDHHYPYYFLILVFVLLGLSLIAHYVKKDDQTLKTA